MISKETYALQGEGMLGSIYKQQSVKRKTLKIAMRLESIFQGNDSITLNSYTINFYPQIMY